MSITIDESLYSRQLYAIGKDTMQSLITSKVLIIGLDPLGVEICKNLILSGVGMITILDDKLITDKDYGNYYISSEDIGKIKSDVVGKRLSELNTNCIINKYSGNITKKLLKNFNLVIFIDFKFTDEYFKYNKFCRNNSIKTIFAKSIGFYGFIFCDFGEFITNDPNGEKIKSGIIIDYKNKICTTAKPHDLEANNKIKVKEQIYLIKKIINQSEFELNLDSQSESDSQNIIGEYTEIKSELKLSYKSLKQSIHEPEFVYVDFSDFDKPSKLHNINCAILSDNPSNIDNLDKTDKFTQKILRASHGQLVPLNSVIGGLVSHNVICGLSNKYTPIKQWLYYDCADICEPENSTNWKSSEIYQNQISVIGSELQEKISKTKLFIVGSGAIGCEHLKNFSMMGIGQQTITDMDVIERSNLSRQFLFRNSDIGKYKAEVASAKAKKMNPNVKIEYKLNRVGNDTEHIFNNDFYESIDIIVNALDNVNARIYMDNQAIMHHKPLLESGTLGLKGNVQVILPHLTESYGSTQDKGEDQIPVCTLKNFPYEISHCIQWAREQFESIFVIPFQTYNKLKNDKSQERLKEKLDKMLINEVYETYQNISQIKSNQFDMFIDFYNQHYRQKIYDLINQYPENHVTEEGEKFWSGTRRFPKVIDFDINNNICKNLLESYSQIMKSVGYDIPAFDFNKINRDLVTSNQKAALNQEEDKKMQEDNMNKLDYAEIKKNIIDFIETTDFKFKEIEFEKDDDTNGHIRFVTSCSNLRASNYSITPRSEFETKEIAGKIIPALATTTSIISGLVAIELYKLINKLNTKDYKIENFKNTFLGLGVCFMGSSEPVACKSKKVGNLDINLWTKISYTNMTIDEFIKKLQREYSVKVDQIMYNDKTLYSCFMNITKRNEILNKKIKEIVIPNNSINSEKVNLTISISDKDDNDEIIIVEII
jgi:ubiquitin-activating enzyme E1